jgi:hypothetical protein
MVETESQPGAPSRGVVYVLAGMSLARVGAQRICPPYNTGTAKVAAYSERPRATVRVPLSLSVRTQPFAFPGTMDTEWLRAHLVRWDALGRLSVPQP